MKKMKNITAFWPGLGLINVVPHDWPLETYSEKEKTLKKNIKNSKNI